MTPLYLGHLSWEQKSPYIVLLDNAWIVESIIQCASPDIFLSKSLESQSHFAQTCESLDGSFAVMKVQALAKSGHGKVRPLDDCQLHKRA
jgi:hypothetical protein